MDKKGLTVYYCLWAAMGIAIVIVFGFIAKSYCSGEIFYKIRAAEELALLIETFNAIPGNAYVVYPTDISRYIIDFSEQGVLVKKMENDPKQAFYPITKIEDQKIKKTILHPKRLILGKAGNEITVDTEKLPNLKKLECPKISVAADLKTIFIYADDFDYINSQNLRTFELTNEIALALYSSLQHEAQEILASRENFFQGKNQLSKEKIAEYKSKSDLTIGISIGIYKADRNTLKAYILGDSLLIEKNRKLACLIINSILDKLPPDTFDATAIVPIYTHSALDEDKLGIVLEIANIETEKGSNTLKEKKAEIVSAITMAVGRYSTK